MLSSLDWSDSNFFEEIGLIFDLDFTFFMGLIDEGVTREA